MPFADQQIIWLPNVLAKEGLVHFCTGNNYGTNHFFPEAASLILADAN